MDSPLTARVPGAGLSCIWLTTTVALLSDFLPGDSGDSGDSGFSDSAFFMALFAARGFSCCPACSSRRSTMDSSLPPPSMSLCRAGRGGGAPFRSLNPGPLGGLSRLGPPSGHSCVLMKSVSLIFLLSILSKPPGSAWCVVRHFLGTGSFEFPTPASEGPRSKPGIFCCSRASFRARPSDIPPPSSSSNLAMLPPPPGQDWPLTTMLPVFA
mmetsp:Transcript_6376/g.13568  ORF Transcript_6376/g.13568 Transcript_6376/m.13568 type:complete len:211 (-) Transcript_6376:150-782(-)